MNNKVMVYENIVELEAKRWPEGQMKLIFKLSNGKWENADVTDESCKGIYFKIMGQHIQHVNVSGEYSPYLWSFKCEKCLGTAKLTVNPPSDWWLIRKDANITL